MATYDFTPKANAGLTSVGGNNAIGTLESVVQLQGYVIDLETDSDGSADNPIDLSAVDGAHGSFYDLVLRELAPLMAYAPNSGDKNVIHVIVDGHAQSAAAIKARLVALGAGTDTTVTAASSITIA
jgi:hypothetical protein